MEGVKNFFPTSSANFRRSDVKNSQHHRRVTSSASISRIADVETLRLVTEKGGLKTRRQISAADKLNSSSRDPLLVFCLLVCFYIFRTFLTKISTQMWL